MRPLNISLWIQAIAFIISIEASCALNRIDELRYKAKKEFVSGNYPEALKDHLEALTLAEKSKDCYQIGYSHMQVARIQYYLNNKQLSLSGFFVARSYLDSCGHDTLNGVLYRNIGAIYYELHKIDSSLYFLNKSIRFSTRGKNYQDLSMANALISDIYLSKGTAYYKTAEQHILQAEKYALLANSLDAKVFAALKHAGYCSIIKDHRLAVKYARKALAMEEESGELEGRIYAARILAESLVTTGDPEARAAYDMYIMLKDSIFKKETSDKFASYKISYDTEKKETENKLLQQRNRLNQIEITSKNKTIIGLLIGVVFIIILVFWRISVMNLKKKNLELETAQAIQQEKERISRDLHDNVGGQLSYVLFSLEAKEDDSSEKRKEKADNLARALRSVTGNLRETIWALNQEKLSLTMLSDKLKLYARNMFSYSETKIKFNEAIDNDEELNPSLALNLFRMSQEMINNSFKHARATEIIISFTKKNRILLSVSDNGIGFDLHKATENCFGLKNLKLRAQEINAEIIIDSSPGKGTTITLIV